MVATLPMSTDAFLSLFGARDAHEPRDPMKSAQAGLKAALPKRFYAAASVREEGNAWQLLLDGRPAKTPARRPLAMPSAVLGDALATEWNRQDTHINAPAMPLTRLLNTALDGVASSAGEVRAEIVRFAASDLVCYRAETPRELAERQAAAWDPVLRWALHSLDAHFRVGAGVVHVAQDDGALASVAGAVEAVREPLALAALASVTALTGSALIALALARRAIAVDAAWDAAHVDEVYQASVWGWDDEAELRLGNRRADFDAAALVLSDRVAA